MITSSAFVTAIVIVAALIARRARTFAILIIPKMNHQVRLEAGSSGGDIGKGPVPGIVAILDRLIEQPAAGVAHNQNPLRLEGDRRKAGNV